jgi:hypothetical protein
VFGYGLLIPKSRSEEIGEQDTARRKTNIQIPLLGSHYKQHDLIPKDFGEKHL